MGDAVFYSSTQKRQLWFADQADFCRELSGDIEIIAGKTGDYATEALRRKLQAEYADRSAEFVKEFNRIKANFIRTYLFDNLCREDIYENYATYFNIDAPVSVPKVTIEKRVLVDAYAPEFVQKLQKILNGTDGEGFLRYAALLPARVLAESTHNQEISYGWDDYSYGRNFDFTLALEDPAAYYKTKFDAFAKEIDVSTVGYQGVLPSSLQYYIVDPKSGTTFTNTDYDQPQWLTYFEKSGIRFSVLQGKVSQKGLDTAESDRLLQDRFHEALDVYVVLDVSGAPMDDKYVQYHALFSKMQMTDFRLLLAIAGSCLLLSVALLIFLLVIIGKRRLWIDRLPLEIHLVLSVAAGAGIFLLGVEILRRIGGVFFDGVGSLRQLLLIGFCLLAALGWFAVCELLCSIARILGSGALGDSLITVRCGRFLCARCGAAVKNVAGVLAYQPGAMRKYIWPLLLCWAAANSVLIFVLLQTRSAGVLMLFVVLQLAVAFKALDYLHSLDSIILAAARRQLYRGDVSRLPVSLRLLVQSQQYSKEELDRAVEQAVREERTKAELITNVSHDLKTPLTSVINYIDLLRRCDINDPVAGEYLAVLEDKSLRLKRLIEDLIEASKVSTGNVVLEKNKLSLAELANQAIVEEMDQMEACGLQLVYNTMAAPTVYADGNALYRVFENLLSNARKYSLQGSRVYATVYEKGEYACFELKNISQEPLDIDPAELTGRFVRGDRSRSQEGNGLGLSIAGDLCRLNDGELILGIDGDLFKATVKLKKV